MKDIGIRELKAHASEIVRQVAESHATYAITRRGRAVGILAPPDFPAPAASGAGDQAWARLELLADRLDRGRGRRTSALRGLTEARR